MSLNEIVNCPSQFASSTPYIVVQHIDWIQCRYLFVQVQGGNSSATADYSGGAGNSKKVSKYVISTYVLHPNYRYFSPSIVNSQFAANQMQPMRSSKILSMLQSLQLENPSVFHSAQCQFPEPSGSMKPKLQQRRDASTAPVGTYSSSQSRSLVMGRTSRISSSSSLMMKALQLGLEAKERNSLSCCELFLCRLAQTWSSG